MMQQVDPEGVQLYLLYILRCSCTQLDLSISYDYFPWLLIGIARRLRRAIPRVPYENDGPLDVMHIDGNHKLVNVFGGIYIWQAVDGHTKKGLYCWPHCANTAATILVFTIHYWRTLVFRSFFITDSNTNIVFIIIM